MTPTIQTDEAQIQYVSDNKGEPVGVIVPIQLWRAIEKELRSEQETAYLLSNEAIRKRLLEAKNREGGISLEDARARLGI